MGHASGENYITFAKISLVSPKIGMKRCKL